METNNQIKLDDVIQTIIFEAPIQKVWDIVSTG